jgi:hypothetical protein
VADEKKEDPQPITVVPKRGAFPRICELINTQKIFKPASSTPLEVIAERLTEPLDKLWDWGAQLNLWDAQWNNKSLEEQWARAISELLVGTAYFGPEIAAHLPNRKPLYEQFCSDNPAIGIVNPCETLATYLVLSRGYKPEDVNEVGLDSGDNSGIKVFDKKAGDGRWTTDLQRASFAKAIDKGDLKPGSCFGWQTPNNDKSVPGPHVVGVLRVDEQVKEAQIIDTGAAQSRLSPGDIPFAAPQPEWSIRGNYDNAKSTKVDLAIINTPATFKGLGTPATNFDLAAGLKRLKKARPFGLARLFVATEDLHTQNKVPSTQHPVKEGETPQRMMTVPNKLVFMSRVCRMWGAADTENYSIMRCQWALRSLPGWKATPDGPEAPVFAWWVFYSPKDTPKDTPKDELATLLLKAARATRLDEIPTQANKKKLMSGPFLIARSLGNGRTQWAFVSRALVPSKIGFIPPWMQTLLDEADFDTVFPPKGLSIPAALNDGVAVP